MCAKYLADNVFFVNLITWVMDILKRFDLCNELKTACILRLCYLHCNYPDQCRYKSQPLLPVLQLSWWLFEILTACIGEFTGQVCYLYFFSYIYFFLCILSTSAAPQRPANSTVPFQVATHLSIDKVCRVLGRSWIQTQDYRFAVRCATIEPPLLPLLQLSWWLQISISATCLQLSWSLCGW